MFFTRFGQIKEQTCHSRTFCDYDHAEAPHLLPFFSVARIVGLRPRWVRYDKTRRGWHVVIQWNRIMSDSELVALQFALGSDYKRETLNLMRVMARPSNRAQRCRWNILYERKLT